MKRRIALVAVWVFAVWALLAIAASAHQSPVGCVLSGLELTVSRDRAVARIGDRLAYAVTVANSVPGACDVTGATVLLTLPAADGTPSGQTLTLASNAAFAAGAPATLVGTVPYTVAVADAVMGAAARASVEGVLHDGPVDSPVATSRTVATVITRPHLTLRTTASPVSGRAPLAVTYGYELVNDSTTAVPMVDVSISDDRCSAPVHTGGDATNPGVLDVGETWSYACSTRYDAPGTYVNTTVAGAGSTVDRRPVAAAPATAQVVVSAPPADSTSTAGGVTGSVPATLALSLGTPASLGAFAPGVSADYLAASTATVTSTAGDSVLTVADPATSTAGHLINGAFVMAQAVQVNATSAAGSGSAYAPVGGSSKATGMLTYTGPVSNDQVTIRFKQPVAASDALRTGNYSKTLTFTLSTSQP